MLVFVDDSGDPGFKFDKGSTRYFVIALVIFSDDLEAEKTAVAIKELRRKLGFPDKMEFKFFKSSREVRERFLHAVTGFDFKVRCLVIDKTKLYSDELKNNKDSFYSYAIKMVLKHSTEVRDAKVKIDGSGDRLFRRNFLYYLRKQLNDKERKIIKHCKLVDSKENVLIQLADMVAGSIRRSYDVEKEDHAVYRGIIRKRLDDVWDFK